MDDFNNVSGEAKPSHCPFGCAGEELDEHGYCRHLVGFSNDKKLFEPIFRRENESGEKGRVQVLGGKKAQAVRPTDKLVNPTRVQVVESVRRIANEWVSWRVYRPDDAG